MNYGTKLRQLREEKELTLQKLSLMCNDISEKKGSDERITGQTILNYEKDIHPLNVNKLDLILEALGLTLKEFFS